MMTLGWPWPFYDRVKCVSWCSCTGHSVYSIESSFISKFVLIQKILSTQVSDIGPMVLWFCVYNHSHGKNDVNASLVLFIIQAICRLQWNKFTPNLLYTWPKNKDLSRTYSIVSRNVPLLLFFCVERVFICLMQYLHMSYCLWKKMIFKALSTPQCIRDSSVMHEQVYYHRMSTKIYEIQRDRMCDIKIALFSNSPTTIAGALSFCIFHSACFLMYI